MKEASVMMTVEYCATCGCSEFSHASVEEDCTGARPPSCDRHGERIECECGACDDYRWIAEPDELVCACGCLESEHVDGDVVSTGELLDEPCAGCDACHQFVEVGTELERVRGEIEDRGAPWPGPSVRWAVPGSTVRVRWFAEALGVVGALVHRNGGPERVVGLPEPGDAVYLWFATTADGLEVALTHEDIAG
jgi:hypothetical protein